MNELTIPITETTVEEKEISKALQERLAKVDALEVAIEVMTEKYSTSVEEYGVLLMEAKGLRDLDLRKEQLDTKESELNEREKNLQLISELRDLKIELSEQRVNDHIKMCELIFRNPITMRTSKIPVVLPGVTGDYSTTSMVEEREQTETEEIK